MSRRTVGLALGYLEEQGFIERERQHKRTNGHRAQDRITLRMPSDQTVVQTWRGYAEYLEEKVPSRYVHRPEEPNVYNGPMRSANRPYAFGGDQLEQEEKNRKSTTASTREEAVAMYIEVTREHGDWSVKLHNPGEHFSQDTFCQVVEGLLGIGLDAGVSPHDLSLALQDSWVEASWIETISQFQDRLDALRSQTNVRSLKRQA